MSSVSKKGVDSRVDKLILKFKLYPSSAPKTCHIHYSVALLLVTPGAQWPVFPSVAGRGGGECRPVSAARSRHRTRRPGSSH